MATTATEAKAASITTSIREPWQPQLPTALTPAMIAYEDDYMLIMDKPAGMLVHPTVSQWEGTLYDLVKTYYVERGITSVSFVMMRFVYSGKSLFIIQS